MKVLPVGDKALEALSSILFKVQFFHGFSGKELELLLKCFKLEQYRPNRHIFKQGAAGKSLYIILSGKVEIYIKKGFFSKKTVLGILGSGDFFGEMALLNQKPRSASVKTLKLTKVFSLSRKAFFAVISKNPNFRSIIDKISESRKFQQTLQEI